MGQVKGMLVGEYDGWYVGSVEGGLVVVNL